MWCVSPAVTAKEGPPWFVWVRQHRNERGGRTQGGEGMVTGVERGLECVLDSLDNTL